MLGGLNSLVGVFLGCLALGVAENLAGAYLSPSFADAITFIVIIAVLIVRPEGIFGRVKVRKARRRRRQGHRRRRRRIKAQTQPRAACDRALVAGFWPGARPAPRRSA